MRKDESPVPIRPDDANVLVAWVQDIVRQARLAWRLFFDERVPLWAKLIPPAALAYVLFPIDIIPDVMLGLGQLDDIAVLLIGVKLFVEVAPQDVVREHLVALGARVQEWHVVDEEDNESPTVIEGEFRVEELEAPEAGASGDDTE